MRLVLYLIVIWSFVCVHTLGQDVLPEQASNSSTSKRLPKSADTLSLRQGDRVLLTYQAKRIPSPVVDAPWFGRSGFIHPVYTPSGKIVTSDFPKDHLHQHGLMFAWTSSVVDGRPIDFWNSAKQVGHIEHVETIQANSDKIQVRLHHIDDQDPEKTVVLDETWTVIRVPHESLNVFDLVSNQTCVMKQPLEIKEYHYGAMCVRGPEAWLEEGKMLTSEGMTQKDGNHTRPNWVAMSGPLEGAECGIVAMSHPDNFRAPQPVRLHPKKPYFCFAPMVLGDFQIKPSESYVSRFRFATFDGPVDVEKLKTLWNSFAIQSNK